MNRLPSPKRVRPFGALLVLLLVLPALTAQAQDQYKVVINHEEQYSIWPADREPPEGWKPVGIEGSRKECRAYIEEVWTDMRPLSLREGMTALRIPRDKGQYKVVINHEEQYSIWLHNQELIKPWRDTGKNCSWKDCMAYIEEVWTDMRPLSARP